MVATVSASLPYRNAISRSADCCNSGAYIAEKIDSAELIARAPGHPRRPGAAPPLNLVQAIVVQDTCRDTVRSSRVLPVLAAARYPVQKIKLRHPNGRVSIPSHIPIFTLILTSSPLPPREAEVLNIRASPTSRICARLVRHWGLPQQSRRLPASGK